MFKKYFNMVYYFAHAYIYFVSLATTCKSSKQIMENIILDSIYVKTCLFNFLSTQTYYFQTCIWILPGYDIYSWYTRIHLQGNRRSKLKKKHRKLNDGNAKYCAT